MLDDAFDRGEAGATGDEDQRSPGVFTQVEAAKWPFQPQDGFFVHFAEHILRELAAGHQAQVQFQ